uniref:(northern house mosquito) hypothetical protein n=1 Tax=Culex pipiens TaxID=7175 RepID=A0A8D8MKC7_CULPI
MEACREVDRARLRDDDRLGTGAVACLLVQIASVPLPFYIAEGHSFCRFPIQTPGPPTSQTGYFHCTLSANQLLFVARTLQPGTINGNSEKKNIKTSIRTQIS